jgi:hypothetical protein
LAVRLAEVIQDVWLSRAFTLIDDLYWRSQLPGIEDLILRLAGRGFPQTSSVAPHVLAARYPAAVGLASLLVRPRWITRATASPRNWRHAAPQFAGAFGLRCRLTESTYQLLSRWNLDRCTATTQGQPI